MYFDHGPSIMRYTEAPYYPSRVFHNQPFTPRPYLPYFPSRFFKLMLIEEIPSMYRIHSMKNAETGLGKSLHTYIPFSPYIFFFQVCLGALFGLEINDGQYSFPGKYLEVE